MFIAALQQHPFLRLLLPLVIGIVCGDAFPHAVPMIVCLGIMVLLAFLLPYYKEEGKTVLVVAVGCTGGHHRSVAVTRALVSFIRQLGYPVTENHRDMTRN